MTVKQKSDLVVLHGLSFCLRCDVDRGVPPAEHIAWQFNGEGISLRDVCLNVRANETELCFTNITRPYSGTYQCFVMNEAGSDDGGINVTVAGKVVINGSHVSEVTDVSMIAILGHYGKY